MPRSASDPNSRFWNREFEQGLPDSRLSRGRRDTTLRIRGVLYERVFCADCGTPSGAVTAEMLPHVFFLCDACALKGVPATAVEVPAPPGTVFDRT